MKCPFLTETRVRSCQTAAFRKMIVETPENSAFEKCSKQHYTDCQLYRENGSPDSSQPQCPSLRESLVQYCSAAPVPKFIPYSESQLCRCGTEAHHYCDLYLEMANAGRQEMPERLSYSANHMWLDLAEDGFCHVGVDAFLARLLRPLTKISFLTMKGFHRPAAVLTVGDVDLQMVFPNPILLSRCNVYLRANPNRLLDHPYSYGWLFEGWAPPPGPGQGGTSACAGLIRGPARIEWIERETERLTQFAHAHAPSGNGPRLMADGGEFSTDLIEHLNREELQHLFHEFFSPLAGWAR